jgi:hypothetical protein
MSIFLIVGGQASLPDLSGPYAARAIKARTEPSKSDGGFVRGQNVSDEFLRVSCGTFRIPPPILNVSFLVPTGLPVLAASLEDFGASGVDTVVNEFPSFDHHDSAISALGVWPSSATSWGFEWGKLRPDLWQDFESSSYSGFAYGLRTKVYLPSHIEGRELFDQQASCIVQIAKCSIELLILLGRNLFTANKSTEVLKPKHQPFRRITLGDDASDGGEAIVALG